MGQSAVCVMSEAKMEDLDIDYIPDRLSSRQSSGRQIIFLDDSLVTQRPVEIAHIDYTNVNKINQIVTDYQLNIQNVNEAPESYMLNNVKEDNMRLNSKQIEYLMANKSDCGRITASNSDRCTEMVLDI